VEGSLEWHSPPQGSVGLLGSVLFLIFSNGLNRLLKFADDTKVYYPVNNQVNSIRLRKDFIKLWNGLLAGNAVHCQLVEKFNIM